jgi:hypothetical protein
MCTKDARSERAHHPYGRFLAPSCTWAVGQKLKALNVSCTCGLIQTSELVMFPMPVAQRFI